MNAVPPLQYYLDAKRVVDFSSESAWDIFVSAFNDTDRVQEVFDEAPAVHKEWWVIPEYGYQQMELPGNRTNMRVFSKEHEADLVIEGLAPFISGLKGGARLCVDITGFMRPQILFLMYYLKRNNVHNFDFIYTEPQHYSRKAETAFSLDEDSLVRQVAGFEGQHIIDMTSDVLILGGGYDHSLVGRVIANKESAKLVQLQSLPSLSADMYHESLLRLDRVASTSETSEDHLFYSSANDPFVTAETLSTAVSALSAKRSISNLYLSTLATKPQAVGFGLFYLRELEGRAASIIYPYFNRYSRETSSGRGRSWLYPIHL